MNSNSYRVCTFPYEPIAFCNNNLTQSYGFLVDVFTDIASKLQVKYILQCLNYKQYISEMMTGYMHRSGSQNTSCDIFIGMVSADEQLYKTFQTTTPVLWSGINIITHKHHKAHSDTMFGFLNAFSTSIWLAILCMILGFALMSMFIHFVLSKGYKKQDVSFKQINPRSKHLLKCMLQWCNVVLTYFLKMIGKYDDADMHGTTLHKVIENILIIGFGSFSMMIMSYYTAVTTTRLSLPVITYDLPSMDIYNIRNSGLRIGMPSRYSEHLIQQFNFQNFKMYEWDTYEDIKTMIDDLLTEKIQALFMDSLVSRYFSSINCNLFSYDQTITSTYTPFFFRQDIDKLLVQQFSEILLDYTKTYAYFMHMKKYIYSRSNKLCDIKSPSSLSFHDVSGLFIICCSIGAISVLIAIIYYCCVHYYSLFVNIHLFDHEYTEEQIETNKTEIQCCNL